MLQVLTISNKNVNIGFGGRDSVFFFSTVIVIASIESGLSAELQAKLKLQCRGGRSQRRGVVSTPPHQGDHLLWFWPNKHSPCIDTVYFLNTTNH